ncbi:MAG TPA: twin-arginine translocase TatA/TatE family subunit [Bdellovibrionales bacterium]|nr:twin-arginine translocase TatA/TatE family subunit [Bdellovibrionales bacterium]
MGMSAWHLILLLVIVMIFFGPSRLPGLGKSLGEAIRGFKKGIGGEDERDVEELEARKAKKKSEDKENV